MKTITLWGKAMILLSLVTGLSSITNAQDQFRLSDYVNPDYQWRKLELGFGLGGNNSFSDQKIENDESFHQQDNQMLYSSDAGLRYYSIKNSPRYQGYQDYDLSGYLNGRNSSDQNILDGSEENWINNTQRLYFNAHIENRFYNSRKRFLEVDLDLSTSLFNGKSEYSDDPEDLPFLETSKNFQYSITASLPVLIGFGRIEEVQDARLAVYILDDLQKSGDLKRAPTAEEVLAFSRFITETKNRRFFDSRIQKINEITRIDSMLNAMDLKAQSGASYYTLLNDNWDYADGPVRHTGGRFSAGIVPKLRWAYNDSESDYHDTLNDPTILEDYNVISKSWTENWGMDFIAAYVWEKPANLYWQHTINTSLAYSLDYDDRINKIYEMDTLSNDFKYETDSPNLKLIAGYRLGFYPNSRTELTLDLNNILGHYWHKSKSDDMDEMKANTFGVYHELNISCYYYISEQLRLTVTIANTYDYDHNTFPDYSDSKNTDQNLYTSIGAGLVYKIF